MLAFGKLPPDMTEGTLEDWADRIRGNGALFTPKGTNLLLEYVDALLHTKHRKVIRNRFLRALHPLGKKVLPGDGFGT